MLKRLSGMPRYLGLSGLAALAAAALVLAGFSYGHASEIGGHIGSDTGKAVGRAMGSFEGVTKGREDGTEAGRAEGLSAKDTKAELEDMADSIGGLEVMAATVSIRNLNQVGGSYAALYLLRGEAVFTVDLSQAVIDADEEGRLTVLLPEPHMEAYMDAADVEKLADYQRRFFNGSTEAGFEEYINSLREIEKVTRDSIEDYDQLMEQAREAAKRQVRQLTARLRASGEPVAVEFKNGG